MYTKTQMFEDIATTKDGFTCLNKLYIQLVNVAIHKYLVENQQNLINLCRESKDLYFNDVKSLDYWWMVAGNCWTFIDHDKRRKLGINSSDSSQICVLKVAIRHILGKLPEGAKKA